MTNNETEKRGSFSIHDFGVKFKEVPENAKIIYFKKISPVKSSEVAKVWGISPDKYKRIMETDIKDIGKDNGPLYEEKSKILDAVEQIKHIAESSFEDEYGQTVATYKHPHKKYSSIGFRTKMAHDRDDCIMSCSALPGATPGMCPTFQIYYPISETQYKKEMELVKKRRDKLAQESAEYYENLDKLIPEKDKLDGAALEKVMAIRQSIDENEKIRRPDPDKADHESIFSDKEQRRAQRRLRNQIQPNRPF